MRVAKSLGSIANGLLWRTTRQAAFGRRLVDALGDPDESARAIAGMMLARSSADALPLLRRALLERRNLPEVLTLMGDLGDPWAEQQIAPFASDPDERVARAARDALRVLKLRLAAG